MVVQRVTVLLTLCGLLVAPSVTTQSTTQKSCGPPPMESMYTSHEGTAITSIGLSESEMREVISEVLRRDFVREMGITSADDLKSELLARNVDMGEGSASGLVVQGQEKLCGATGNCIAWFFRRGKGSLQSLGLGREYPPDAAAFAFLPPKHKGLSDLVVERNDGGGIISTFVWQFNGSDYEPMQSFCFECKAGGTEVKKCQ